MSDINVERTKTFRFLLFLFLFSCYLGCSLAADYKWYLIQLASAAH